MRLHTKDVQHRDIKPANLLLLQKGVKVADFGLAKLMAETAASHTGAMTISYAAPEFFKGTTSQQSDQYSLAATYVHLRTGHLLFEGSYHQVAYGHMSVPPNLSRLPAAEQAVLAGALAKEPEKRWRTCKTFVNELIKAHQAALSEHQPKRLSRSAPRSRLAQRRTCWPNRRFFRGPLSRGVTVRRRNCGNQGGKTSLAGCRRRRGGPAGSGRCWSAYCSWFWCLAARSAC